MLTTSAPPPKLLYEVLFPRFWLPKFGIWFRFRDPWLLGPLTFAWRYQKVNADYLTERGAAVQLTDETLPDKLLPAVRDLLFHPEHLALMSVAAGVLDKPDAAAHLARLLLAKGARVAQEEELC